MQNESRHTGRRFFGIAAFLCMTVLLSLSSGKAEAATCTYTNFSIGYEAIAVEGPNASGQYHYVVTPLRCDSTGQVIYDPGVGFSNPYDMGWTLPSTLVSSFKSTFGSPQGRFFVSGCSTQMLFVNKYWPAAQSIAGVSMVSYPNGAVYSDVFKNPVYLKSGPNIGIAKDPVTASCALRPDSGLNAGQCVAGADNGFGSSSVNGTNPINPAWRGNKIQRETDYVGAGASPLNFVRTYNSRAARVAGLNGGFDSDIAGLWTHTYQRSLQLFVPADNTGVNTVQSAALFRPDGKIVVFKPSGSNWVAVAADAADTLAKQSDGTWRYVTSGGDTEIYSAAGKLTSITSPEGIVQTLSYDSGSGRLSTVTDSFGHALSFGYDGSGRLSTLTDPNAGQTMYGYDGQGNLTTVTYPGAVVRTYLYENASYPKALTGITDENQVRYATWAYDTQGRTISSEHGATHSGIDLHGVTYNANGTATVNDALSTARTFTYLDQFSTAKLSNANQPGGSGCGPSSQSVTYDTNGFVQTRTDFNNVQTTYVHNSRGLETSRTEASGKPEARTISTAWHAYWRLPVKVAEPKKLTTYAYNGDGGVFCAPQTATVPNLTGGTQPIGVLCTKTEQATTDLNGSAGLSPTVTGIARIWNYTYNQYGQILTADGPRTDVSDVTTYAYYDATDPDLGKRGNLKSVQNALGHLTQITAYDPNGRPLTVIDPNNQTLVYTYWPRGWLKSVTLGGKTTTYDYDGVGQLTKVTRANGGYTSYHYDGAHRLMSISDSRGDSLSYTRDNAGNITKSDWLNPDTSLARSQRFAYDALGRLQNIIETRNGSDVSTVHGYDANGNPTTVTSFRQKTTSTQYDGLDRPVKVTDPLTGLTQLAYDGRDQLTQLTAPNNAVTGFTVDGLGNVQETSADRGSRPATYDAAGNLKTLSDGRGIVASFTYDALNRLRTISYPQTGENVTYTWDTGSGCTNGVGQLCAITDSAGSTGFAYDARGNLLSETRSEGGSSLTTQYAYDDADRQTTVIAPTGKVLTATLDLDGHVQKVATDVASTPTDVVKNVSTDAAGNVTGQTYGNSVGQTLFFTPDGLLVQQTVTAPAPPSGGDDGDVPLPAWALVLLGAGLIGGLRKRRTAPMLLLAPLVFFCALMTSTPAEAQASLTYDADGNVIQRVGPTGTTTYGYDDLGRLNSEAGPAKTQSLSYDPNGNRLSDGSGNHTYAPSTDRQATISGLTVSLDAAGNITQMRNLGFVWNQAGQLKEVHQGSPSGTLLASYLYDYRGRRVRKVTTAAAPQGAGTVRYHYDRQDHLIAETTLDGSPLITYVWRGDVPIAVIRHGTPETIVYLEVDHLGTPRVARNQAGQIVWQWESDAFGSTTANEDPSNTGTKTTINLRFPGQYFDKESGLHYNMARYYDPNIGRYIQSDPIGLAGGINTYSYVDGNPLSYTDPLGLARSSGMVPGESNSGLNSYSGGGGFGGGGMGVAVGAAGLAGGAVISNAITGSTSSSDAQKKKGVEEWNKAVPSNPGQYTCRYVMYFSEDQCKDGKCPPFVTGRGYDITLKGAMSQARNEAQEKIPPGCGHQHHGQMWCRYGGNPVFMP